VGCDNATANYANFPAPIAWAGDFALVPLLGVTVDDAKSDYARLVD
jgi:hypothetical protein